MTRATDFAPVIAEFLKRVEQERRSAMLEHDYIEHQVEQNEVSRAQADRELVQLFQYERRLHGLENAISTRFREVQR